LEEQLYTVALVGNPNVGKSTVFNALTGLHQHTGNWPGKTVAVARGTFNHQGAHYALVDLPGIYSLTADSAEEKIAGDFVRSSQAQATLVVADATCLERNLFLLLQILFVTHPVVLCVNLTDEAKKKGIEVDIAALSRILEIEVIPAAARNGKGIENLRCALARAVQCPRSSSSLSKNRCADLSACSSEERTAALHRLAAEIAAETVHTAHNPYRRDRKLDRLFTSRVFGGASMALLFLFILWLTVAGANIPSQALCRFLFSLQKPLTAFLAALHLPPAVQHALTDGVYRTAAWVIGVMLPPMAIFFPLFTLLEDVGYLPRIAFNLDRCFRCAGTNGRQSLTMCMGLGCNACGVTGCRIISGRRERLIAILTNSFVPCNGRFPTLIALVTMFFVSSGAPSFLSAAAVLVLLILSVGITLLVSRILSVTVLRGEHSPFSLELPPYRIPQISQVLVRSVFDRTLFVLGRALSVAAPAGLLIWLLAHCTVQDVPLLSHLASFLEPAGKLMGLDGMILLAFLLGFPANEIVLPILLMGYLSTGMLTDYSGLPALKAILLQNGWTVKTAVCAALFTLFHFPCSTTCLTIRAETGSWKWTALAAALPTLVGFLLCTCVNLFWP